MTSTYKLRRGRHCWPVRMVAIVLIAVEAILPSAPLLMSQSFAAVPAAAVPDASTAVEPMLLAPFPEPPPVLTPKDVEVNRTVPAVERPKVVPEFSLEPTDKEFRHARVFTEPLVPLNGASTGTTPAENKDLARALSAFYARGDHDDVGALELFLKNHPDSAWEPSLLFNIGSVHYRNARFSSALAAWLEAWRLSKDQNSAKIRAVADGIAAGLIRLYIAFGRQNEIRSLLGEIDARGDVRGSAAEWVIRGREALWQMEQDPESTFKCGPFALAKIRQVTGVADPVHKDILDEPSTDRGTSLAQIGALARRIGMDFQAARRDAGRKVLVPSVVHWKLGHFSAITKEENGRYLVEDAVFGDPIWVKQETLDTESSGYFLVSAGSLPSGWHTVMSEEGGTIWGQSTPTYPDPNRPTPGCGGGGSPSAGGGGPTTECKGMAQYFLMKLSASLVIGDVPVGYNPPVGPAVDFRVTYNQREANQPSTFTFSNLGSLWSHEWLSYLIVDSATTTIRLIPPGGGALVYPYDSASGRYKTEIYSQTELVKNASTNYVRRSPDGSTETFDVVTGTNPQFIFRSKWTDPQGNSLTFGYDSTNRLVSITDAIGQVTTIFYEHSTDPLKITKVTDPFGRFATFQYDSSLRLTNITDVIGISSSFSYTTNDLINAMTTPYGTTTFEKYESGSPFMRRIQATDPLGERELLEHSKGTVAQTVSTNEAPAGMDTAPGYGHSYRNTFFWDKKAMREHPEDRSWAELTHWTSTYFDFYVVSESPELTKTPLENRVWFNYAGQSSPWMQGTNNKPSKVGRVLDDGTTQLYQFAYNFFGKVTNSVDPAGRTTSYVYATNELNLMEVQQTVGTNKEVLAKFTYTTNHLVLSAVDAAGQTNSFGYNARGQLSAVTNALQEVVSLYYDTNGYLTNITAALPGATTDYTYDAYGRVRTVKDSEGYTITYDYNSLDQVTKVTYPDESYEQIVYNKLDPEWHRDRVGRWSRNYYNPLRKVTAIQDPMGRLTQFDWCGCGTLEAIVDPNRNRTSWIRDEQGRPIYKLYADSTFEQYNYERTTSRLKSVQDAKGQVTNYEYFADDNLKQVSYTNSAVVTPAVSFAYDTNYNSITSMTDGTGATTYGYHAVGSLGAGKLATVDGPLTNDAISYSYDALGRLTSRDINGSGVLLNYDALRRVRYSTNALGTFTNTYVNTTDRLNSVLYPNGQTTTFGYYPNTNDHRLQTIWHKKSNGTTISKFEYTYFGDGQIKTLAQKTDDNSPMLWEYRYDDANKLLGAALKSTGTGASILKDFAYRYDPSGNRLSEQIDGGVSRYSHNSANQILRQEGGGWIRFQGSLSEPGAATVNGKQVAVLTNGSFSADVEMQIGTNVIPVIALDYSGNVRTNQYAVVVTNTTIEKAFSYDLNGNTTHVVSSTTTNAYEWDAADRLVAIEIIESGQPLRRSEFEYDGLSRMVRIVQKENGSSINDKRLLWEGTSLAEERTSSGEGVLKRYYPNGYQAGTNIYYYSGDHLGSIREVIDRSENIHIRYDYSSYGDRDRLVGSEDADFGYTGHYTHQASGLVLARYRQYAPNIGRWLSRDRFENAELLPEGPGLYAYAANNPINLVDGEGEFAVPGAIIGGVFSLGFQLWMQDGNVKCVDWADVGISAVQGGLGFGFIKSLGKFNTAMKSAKKLRGINDKLAKGKNLTNHLKGEIRKAEAAKQAAREAAGAMGIAQLLKVPYDMYLIPAGLTAIPDTRKPSGCK